jgi:hypothetical protein
MERDKKEEEKKNREKSRKKGHRGRRETMAISYFSPSYIYFQMRMLLNCCSAAVYLSLFLSFL